MRIALAQINPLVGDVAGNEQLVRARLLEAREAGAQIVLFPELVLTGYPPEDLLLKEHVLADARAALERLAADAQGIVAVVGFPERARDVYNAAAVLCDGEVQAVYRKCRLPNYGVFDEHRYFQRGRSGGVIEVDGVLVGLTVCEDIWVPGPPASDEALAGARLIVNISASPYQAGKGLAREQMIGQRARDELCAIAFCAQVGGQDELVFDGHSFVVDHTGTVIARAPQFEESLLICTVDVAAAGAARLRDTRQRAAAFETTADVDMLGSLRTGRPGHSADPPQGDLAPVLGPDEEVYRALVLGTRDYTRKNGFGHTVLGLSGGIDSALVACVAVDALGADAVTCVTMPSRYTSEGTFGDAQAIAANLGVRLIELPIAGVVAAYEEQLAGALRRPRAGPDGGEPPGADPRERPDGAVEQVRPPGAHDREQVARWRSATRRCTATAPAASPSSRTCRRRSSTGWQSGATRRPDAPIPQTIITRPPSAELRPDQTDQDSLPPYDVLDPILEGYVERDQGRDQLIARGYEPEVVDRIIRLVDLAEYKRRQQPPGIKITSRAFGRDRRMPITSGYRE